ncbi:MAG: hypothetical protein M1118_11325 [Chloroflexi bacterium]|nr:hypothetical protein [Chloroflexota bacterium]
MTARDLDNAVWAHIEEILTNPDVVNRELDRLKGDDPTAGDVSALDRRLTEVSRQQRNLVANLALVEGEAAAMVADRIKELGEQRQRLQTEREGVLRRRQMWEGAQARLRQVEAWCHRVASNLDHLDYKQRRLALEALGARTMLWPADHSPRWRLECTVPLDDDIQSYPSIVKVDDVNSPDWAA